MRGANGGFAGEVVVGSEVEVARAVGVEVGVGMAVGVEGAD